MTTVRKAAELPTGNFRLSEVDLRGARQIPDEEVDRLQLLSTLRSLKLPEIDKDFLLTHSYAGTSSDGILNKLHIKAMDGTRFTGDHFVLAPGGAVKHQARVTGKIEHGHITYSYGRADIVKDGGHLPIRVDGMITRTRVKVTWHLLDGNASGVIVMKR